MGIDAERAAGDLGVAYWWVSPEGGTVEIGGGWTALFGGLAPKAPRHLAELVACVHPEDRQDLIKRIGRDTPQALSLRLIGEGGRVLPVLCRMAPAHGGTTGLLVATPPSAAAETAVSSDAEDAAMRALAALPDGVSVYDPEDRLVLTNSRMTDIFGYRADRPTVGRFFGDLVREVLDRQGVPEAVGHEEEWLADMLRARAAGDHDYESELADGRIIRVRDRLLPDGWRVGTRVDVTDLRHRERAANDALAKLRAAIECLPDAVFLLDEEGRFLLANEQVRKLFPLMADTIVPGNRFADMLRVGLERGAYPDAVGREEEWLAEAMAFWNRDEPTHERTVRLANGRWVLAVDRRLPAGGWISLRIDVTDLKANEARLAAILDGAGHGTWEWDVENEVCLSNPLIDRTIDYWLTSVGYSRADITGTQVEFFRSLCHPDDLARLDAAQAIHLAGKSDRIDVELRQRHKNGSWVWGNMRGKVCERDVEGRPVRMAGVLADITALKRVQLDLERSARLKLEFLERISHEIRTPLNGVLGALSLLRAGEVTPEQQALFDVAERSGEKLVAMIDRLVDLSRLEDGRIQIAPGPISFADLAADLRAAHGPAAAARGLVLDILTDPNAARPRRADALQLRRMLDRIIEHAFGRTETGAIEVRLRTIPDDGVRIEVADSGPPMSEADFARVLEPMFHENGNARDADHGDGLGLWAVKRLAEAMGGTLAVSREPGHGLLLRLDLPLPLWTGAGD